MAGIDATSAEICAYKFTVEAIACIERAFGDLAGAGLRQGPRMRTPDGAVVTPDMTLESSPGHGGAGYRAVGEVKASFPRHAAAVDQMVRQVRRYDGELAGWEDEAAGVGGRGGHDILIVVMARHAPDFAAGLPAALGKGGAGVESPLSIIGIARDKSDGGSGEFHLKRHSGTISHARAHDALGGGWPIDARSLADELGCTKFYDSRPPLPYIMYVLWIYVFPNLVHGKKLKKIRMNAEVWIDADVDRIHRLASKLAHPSNPGCVKRAWIWDAMGGLEEAGLAEKTGKGKYSIRYSPLEPRAAKWLAGASAAAAEGGPDGAGGSAE